VGRRPDVRKLHRFQPRLTTHLEHCEGPLIGAAG
jgi:hypothetical protein